MNLNDLREKKITLEKGEKWRILQEKMGIFSLNTQKQQKLSFSREKMQ